MKELVHTVVMALIAFVLVLGWVALALGDELRHVEFATPLWGWAALVPIAALVIRHLVRPGPAAFRFSRAASVRGIEPGFATRFAQLPDGLRLAAALCIVVVLARPQSSRSTDRVYHEGIDIAVAVDLSESMAASDLPPSRLHAAKLVLDAFIRRRTHDRIALVAFGTGASTVSPLTTDHGVLRSLVARLQLGVMDGKSTAIGAGLGVALNRLAESESKTKVIVLLTDGVQTAGGVHPDTVAQEAADRGVAVYTILIGNHAAESVNPAQLERIAGATGGYAYTAQDGESLGTSFMDLLDKLEKSQVAGDQIRAELFPYFLWPILALLMLEVVLRNTRLRRFP